MKTSQSRIVLGAVVCAVGLLSLTAQQPVPPPTAAAPAVIPEIPPQPIAPQVRRRVVLGAPGAENSQRAPLVPLLSRNYLLKLTVTEGERVTECRLVTAAPQISVSTVPGGEPGRALSISGAMDEMEDGGVGISLSVQAVFGESGVDLSAPRPPRQNGANESFNVSLQAKPGVEYPLFTTGARTYRLTVTPHEAQGAVPAK